MSSQPRYRQAATHICSFGSMALYFTGDSLLEWTWRCAELTASRYILRSDAVPRAATARYVSVVPGPLDGVFEETARFHPALHDTAPDRGVGHLHDDVGGPGEQGGDVEVDVWRLERVHLLAGHPRWALVGRDMRRCSHSCSSVLSSIVPSLDRKFSDNDCSQFTSPRPALASASCSAVDDTMGIWLPQSVTALRTYAGEQGDERIARRREQLMDAALEVLGSDDGGALTVRGVCREAKLTARYFYESFDSADDLVAAA